MRVTAAVERLIKQRLDRARLLEPRVWGPAERLSVASTASIANAYLNTVSGTIAIGEDVLFGHDVAVLASGADDDTLRGSRVAAMLGAGRDVSIGRGVRVGARAVISGPCRIGPYAVVEDGAVVAEDVPAGAVVAGNPARVLRRLGVVGDLPPSVQVDTDVGPLRALLSDEVITPALQRDGRWEPEHADALRSLLRPGMSVVDVGANIGYTALVAADVVGPDGGVVAVEPHPDNVALLRANVEGDERIEVVAAAGWREATTVTLAVSAVNAGDHRTHVLACERDTIEVEAVRLDDVLGERHVDLIKLDCQGCEHVVLEGASSVIERCRPLIVSEFWPIGIRQFGDDPLAVLRSYRALGYDIRVIEEPILGGAPEDDAIVSAIEARPDPVGGFATLLLRPAGDLTVCESRRRSQNGEDGVIAEILRRIGVVSRFFVEFGAETGEQGNCIALAEDGWEGLLLEADATKYAALEARWRDRAGVRTRLARVEPDTINELLRAGDAPPEPDVFSIDIDGHDWYVWKALTACRPRLLVVEYNGSLPLDRCLVQPLDLERSWDGTDWFGGSLGAFERLGEQKGYRLVHTESRGVNAFFVRSDLLEGSGLTTGEAVRRHRADYDGRGSRHPRDPQDRPWLDLDDEGTLVRVAR